MPSASGPQGFVADQRGACRAHRKGGGAGRLVWSHRHGANFAFTLGVDKLQSHLDPVGIRLVEDELRIPNERLALGIERTRSAGSGSALHRQQPSYPLSLPPGRT